MGSTDDPEWVTNFVDMDHATSSDGHDIPRHQLVAHVPEQDFVGPEIAVRCWPAVRELVRLRKLLRLSALKAFEHVRRHARDGRPPCKHGINVGLKVLATDRAIAIVSPPLPPCVDESNLILVGAIDRSDVMAASEGLAVCGQPHPAVGYPVRAVKVPEPQRNGRVRWLATSAHQRLYSDQEAGRVEAAQLLIEQET